jgi:isopentenyldiphosphate isomerase
MLWRQFKEFVEAQGVTDESEIDHIDYYVADKNLAVYDEEIQGKRFVEIQGINDNSGGVPIPVSLKLFDEVLAQ